jgi:hypothetical protein
MPAASQPDTLFPQRSLQHPEVAVPDLHRAHGLARVPPPHSRSSATRPAGDPSHRHRRPPQRGQQPHDGRFTAAWLVNDQVPALRSSPCRAIFRKGRHGSGSLTPTSILSFPSSHILPPDDQVRIFRYRSTGHDLVTFAASDRPTGRDPANNGFDDPKPADTALQII